MWYDNATTLSGSIDRSQASIIGLFCAQGGQVELVKHSTKTVLSPALTKLFRELNIRKIRKIDIVNFFIALVMSL